MDVIILTNGPGEIVSWTAPIIHGLKSAGKKCRIVTALVPCRYATGNESAYLSKLNQGGKVLVPRETTRMLLTGRYPDGSKPSPSGVVVFLGGDLLWAWLLAKRLSYRSVAYTEGIRTFFTSFDAFYTRTEDGDLMVDAFSYLADKRTNVSMNRVTFFPGSREAHFRLLVPFFKEVALLLRTKGIACNLGVSPFISDNVFAQIRTSVELSSFNIMRASSAEIFAVTDLLVTIPGTNTAQAAMAGVPMLTIMPINNPEVIPLDGLAGMLEKLPLIGRLIKRALVKYFAGKQKYISIPNIKSDRAIVPEMKGILSPKEVAAKVQSILDNPRESAQSAADAISVMGIPGLSTRIVGDIKRLLDEEENAA